MKLGLSVGGIVGTYGIEEGLKLVKKSGFDTIDVSLTGFGLINSDIYSASEDEFLSYFSNFKKNAMNLNLKYLKHMEGLPPVFQRKSYLKE